MASNKTALDSAGVAFTIKTTESGGINTPHQHVDSVAQPTALSTQTVTSTGAASTVTFASAALVSGVAYVYAPSTNASNVWVNKVGSAASEVGLLVEAGKQIPLPPCDNANLYQAYFVGASDKLIFVGS